MATRKLNVELDVETSKAKQKIKTLGENAGSANLAGSADKAAKALDGTASSANKLTQASKMSAERLRSIATAFGGLGIRMATAYAASNMQEGSAGQTAVQLGGGAIAGALQGAVAGPLGAIAGGIMGLTTELISANAKAREAERERASQLLATCQANEEQLKTLFEAEQRAAEFKSVLKDLGGVMSDDTKAARLKEEIAKRERSISLKDSQLIESTNHHFANDKTNEVFRKTLAERQVIIGELEQLKSLMDSRQEIKSGASPFRVSDNATDALSRIGANFGGDHINAEQLKTAQQSLNVLKEIERQTKKSSGVMTWQ